MNISGVVIKCKPENLEMCIKNIQETQACEYHLHDDKGLIVCTIEGDSVEDEMSVLQILQDMDGVISAEMVYSYNEDELDKLRDDLETNDKVPDWLNKKDIKLNEIRYGGDLRNK